MKTSGPTTIWLCSVTQIVLEDKQTLSEFGAVALVTWSEQRGGLGVLISEIWTPVARDIFVATSLKK